MTSMIMKTFRRPGSCWCGDPEILTFAWAVVACSPKYAEEKSLSPVLSPVAESPVPEVPEVAEWPIPDPHEASRPNLTIDTAIKAAPAAKQGRLSSPQP